MQQLQGGFPDDALANAALKATVFDIAATGWSTGARRIIPISVQPTLARPWTIYGFAMQGQGVLISTASLSPFGALGKVYGAPLFSGTSGAAQAPFTQPTSSSSPSAFLEPDPSSLPNLLTLWDGSQDRPFPSIVNGIPPAGAGHWAASMMLPQPQTLGASDQLAIGLWLTPSLITHQWFIAIYNVKWTILYDT